MVWLKDIFGVVQPVFFAFSFSSLFLNFLKVENIIILIIMIANSPTKGDVTKLKMKRGIRVEIDGML